MIVYFLAEIKNVIYFLTRISQMYLKISIIHFKDIR